MMPLSQDETCACRTVQKISKIKDIVARFSKRILSQAGFSLPEFITSAAISTFIAAVAVVVFMMAFETYNRMVRQYEAEIEMGSALFALRSALMTAVKVDYCGNASTANNGHTRRGVAPADRSTRGCIFTGNFNTINAVNQGTANLLALVVRDQIDNLADSVNTNNYSQLTASAVYYQRPTANQSGALYIDQERSTTGRWVRLSPLNAPQMFTRLVEFEARNAKVYDPATANIKMAVAGTDDDKPIISVEYRLTMRFYTGGKASQFNWRPIASMSVAVRDSLPTFLDVEKTVKVNFVNNDMDRTKYLSPRVLGNVHLFNIVSGVRK